MEFLVFSVVTAYIPVGGQQHFGGDCLQCQLRLTLQLTRRREHVPLKYVFSYTCMMLQPRRRRYIHSSTCKTWEICIDCLLKWRISVFSLTSVLVFQQFRWIWSLKFCNRECEWPSLVIIPVVTRFIRYVNVGDKVVSRRKVAGVSWRFCIMSSGYDDLREGALRISIAARAEWSSLLSYRFPPKSTVPGTHWVQYVDSSIGLYVTAIAVLLIAATGCLPHDPHSQ
jgi:hypothetical protein